MDGCFPDSPRIQGLVLTVSGFRHPRGILELLPENCSLVFVSGKISRMHRISQASGVFIKGQYALRKVTAARPREDSCTRTAMRLRNLYH